MDNKATLMKHKEMVSKLGHLMDGSSEYTGSHHPGRTKDRKTHKAPTKRNYLSPSSTKSRRGEITKSQNRVKPKNKFLSEEREKPNVPRPTDVAPGSMSSGFRNYRKPNYGAKEKDNTTYVSKYQNSSTFSGEKRSVSKDVIGTYKSSAISSVYNNGVYETQQKVENDPELDELDEKCQDISEIEIDPEDNKEASLYPKPYQGYGPSSKSSREEIKELIIKADGKSWIDRMNAFDLLGNYLGNKAQFLPDVTMF